MLRNNLWNLCPSLVHLKWWSRFSVLLVFCLIFIGALVTSWQAGMAVPDWPLSFGSLNPDGWWGNLPVRLEHGHRLVAALVGLVTGVLCSAVWGNFRALGIALGVSVAVSAASSFLGVPPSVRMHLGIWPAAASFLVSLLWSGSERSRVGRTERMLAFVAFVLVCCQATLGGLRVTQETAGLVNIATTLRVIHGCVAQAFLVSLVALASRIGLLSGPTTSLLSARNSQTARWIWLAVVGVYIQLVIGATMRHLGAGLAIPSFPAANPEGGWMPKVHNLYTDLNFTHTRVGAFVVVALVLLAVVKTLRQSVVSAKMRQGAVLALVIVFSQAVLGVLVVLHQKPKTLATFHVVLGASLLACLSSLLVHALSAQPDLHSEASS